MRVHDTGKLDLNFMKYEGTLAVNIKWLGTKIQCYESVHWHVLTVTMKLLGAAVTSVDFGN
jgi:hypothetical protein